MSWARGIVVLVALGAALSATAQESDEPRLEPVAPGLGERAILILHEIPADSTQLPQGIHAALAATDDPLRFTVVPLRVGAVGVVLPGADTLRWLVPASLDVDSLPEPRGLASVGILEPNWWPTGLALGAIIFPLVYLIWRRFRRRDATKIAFPFVAEAPHLVALRRLEEIVEARYLDSGLYDRFFVQTSHVLRSYIAARYRVPALDWTSDELQSRIRAAGYAKDAVAGALPLLGAADEVKFAGHRPSEDQAEEWLEEARRYIHATRVEAVYTTEKSVAAANRLQEEGA